MQKLRVTVFGVLLTPCCFAQFWDMRFYALWNKSPPSHYLRLKHHTIRSCSYFSCDLLLLRYVVAAQLVPFGACMLQLHSDGSLLMVLLSLCIAGTLLKALLLNDLLQTWHLTWVIQLTSKSYSLKYPHGKVVRRSCRSWRITWAIKMDDVGFNQVLEFSWCTRRRIYWIMYC